MNKTYKFKNVAKFIFDNIGAELFGEINNKKLSVAVLGNCEEIHEFFKKCGINSEYYPLTTNNLNSVINFLKDKNNMPKFDVIIGNPPYTRGGKDSRPLYIEILSKIIENAKKTIWICPTQWVFGYNIKGNVINDFKNKYFLSDYKHIINPFENTNMANLIGIYTFDNNPNKIDYEEIFYNQFSNPEMTKNILQKYKNYPKHLSDFNNKEHNYKFYVNTALIRGNIDQATGKKKWDWTTLFGEDQRNVFDKKLKDRNIFWNMKTLNECKNFVTENEYDVMEFAQFMGKSNTNIFLELTPWFDDYTVLRTENEIAKKLKLTKEEVEYIHQEMKNFGWKASPRKKNNVTSTNVVTIDKEQINKLNAKAMVMRKTFTAKQNKIYHKMFDGEWAKINKKIDLNNKLERSLAFAKARISCAKKVLM